MVFHQLATIAGNLPYFDILYVGKYNNYLLPFSTAFLVPYQYKIFMNHFFRFIHFWKEGDVYNLNFVHNFGLLK